MELSIPPEDGVLIVLPRDEAKSLFGLREEGVSCLGDLADLFGPISDILGASFTNLAYSIRDPKLGTFQHWKTNDEEHERGRDVPKITRHLKGKQVEIE